MFDPFMHWSFYWLQIKTKHGEWTFLKNFKPWIGDLYLSEKGNISEKKKTLFIRSFIIIIWVNCRLI